MKDLTSGNEGKLIFFFALPMLLGNVLQQLYNTVDGIIVGRAIGKSALAAVGASFPIIFLLVSFIMGIGMGATILVSQFYGAKDYEKVEKTVDSIFIAMYIGAIIITIIGFVFSRPILELLKTPTEIIVQATIYLKVTFIGMIGMVGFNLISAILRGLGDSKTPLYFLVISTIVNIVLDILFIIILNFGVAGAAWATILAQTLAFLFGIMQLNKKHSIVKIKLKDLKFDMVILKKSIKIGLPGGIKHMLVSIGIIVIQVIVNPFGTTVIAAYTIGSRLQSFGVMPIMNINMAISSFVGQNLGAGKNERVKKGYRAAMLMSISISLVVILLVFIFGRQLIYLFNTDKHVIDIGYKYLLIVSPFFLAASVMFITSGAIRGAGDTVATMIISIFALWAARIPVAKILSIYMGYIGIFWSVGADWTVGAILTAIYYMSGRWKKRISINEFKDN